MGEKVTHIIEDVIIMERSEDGGQFTGCSINNSPDQDNGMYVTICSWDENKQHEEYKKFLNRKVRVTIETID
jgi:hypothetical protein